MLKVNVLLSTYNGEIYLEEQIESVLHQTYPHIALYIRDDGSSDSTVKIIQDIQQKNPNKITLFIGKNLGFGKSFLQLLKASDSGDLWAFCDQDDIWYPDKIETAVNWFCSHPQNEFYSKPMLFHSAFSIVDENLKFQSNYLPPSYDYGFIRSITDCVHMGFSEVINGTLRQMMLQANINRLTSHDHWAELLAMAFGIVKFDPEIKSLHRRLQSSVSEGTFQNRIKWFKGAWKGNSDILPCAQECFRLYAQQLSPKDRKALSWFVFSSYDIQKSICKAFYPKRWRPGILSELSIRLLMLCGKI